MGIICSIVIITNGSCFYVRCVITGNLLHCHRDSASVTYLSTLPRLHPRRLRSLPVLTHRSSFRAVVFFRPTPNVRRLRSLPVLTHRSSFRAVVFFRPTPNVRRLRSLPVLTHRSHFGRLFFQVALLCSLLQASYAACYPLLRAIRIPPTMQARSSTLITSKGSRNWPFSVPIKVLPISFIGTSAVEGS